MRRPTVAEVDLAAIEANVAELRRIAAPATCCVVVKAGGYGHGAVEVAQAAVSAGADELAVATVDEALELRDAAVAVPVLLLVEPWSLHAARDAVRGDMSVTIWSSDALGLVEEAAAIEGRVARVEVKLDTGMHRYGATPADALGLLRAVEESRALRLGGVWTHLAVADDPARPETAEQLDLFDRVAGEFAASGGSVPRRHAANSAGAIAHPRSRYEMVRCGIAAYGIAPSGAVAPLVPLRPVLTLRSAVARVAELPVGEGLSYGLGDAASTDRNVATVPIGYADGVDRGLGFGVGEVLIGGRRRRIVGAVTMDHLMVDCGSDSVSVGDEVVLLGTQGDERVDPAEWAARLGTIPYEIVTRLSTRLPRHHLRA